MKFQVQKRAAFLLSYCITGIHQGILRYFPVQAFSCSKSTIETVEEGVKCVQI